jgi:CubicO group peptidase (beta-lactamase class C family)
MQCLGAINPQDFMKVNAEILVWMVNRVSGKSLAALLSDTIWSKLGAEYDAYFWVDGVGSESGGGGLNTALRDLARAGGMVGLNGRHNGQQIISSAVVEDICRGGNKAHLAKASYPTLPGRSYRIM